MTCNLVLWAPDIYRKHTKWNLRTTDVLRFHKFLMENINHIVLNNWIQRNIDLAGHLLPCVHVWSPCPVARLPAGKSRAGKRGHEWDTALEQTLARSASEAPAASMISHLSDVSRAASSLMWAMSSLSKFLFAFDSSFSSYFWTRLDRIWLTVSWTIAGPTDSAIRIQAFGASLACYHA